jgi:hypothetical protein
MRKTGVRVAVLATTAILAAMQVYRPAKTNPPFDASATFEAILSPPPDVTAAVRRGSTECHSNQTSWPWYTHVAPASWLASLDVTEGRAHLNLSEWGLLGPAMSRARLVAMCSEVQKGGMPPVQFAAAHRGARFSGSETAALCRFAAAQQTTSEGRAPREEAAQ